MDLNPHGQLPLLPGRFFLLFRLSLASLYGFRVLLELFPERNAICAIGRGRGLGGCVSSRTGGGEESGCGDGIRTGCRCGVTEVVELVTLRAERASGSPTLAQARM